LVFSSASRFLRARVQDKTSKYEDMLIVCM
jgi:hypothetical protein